MISDGRAILVTADSPLNVNWTMMRNKLPWRKKWTEKRSYSTSLTSVSRSFDARLNYTALNSKLASNSAMNEWTAQPEIAINMGANQSAVLVWKW